MSHAKRRGASWGVTDEFWKRVEPLLPAKQREQGRHYVRKPGGGRKPKDPRLVFEAIVYVLPPVDFDRRRARVARCAARARTAEGAGSGARQSPPLR